MIDYFALALTHGLLALAAWRLMNRADLDSEPGEDEGTVAVDPPAPERSRLQVRPRA